MAIHTHIPKHTLAWPVAMESAVHTSRLLAAGLLFARK